MRSNLFVQAAIAAVVFVVAGCDKEAEKVQLQTPVPEASVEATSVECTVSWANIENAVNYSWKLYETAEPTVAVAEDAAYVGRATASKNLLPFAYGNAVKTSSLLC